MGWSVEVGASVLGEGEIIGGVPVTTWCWLISHDGQFKLDIYGKRDTYMYL